MRWSGEVGYSEQVEVEPDVWEPHITKHTYYGDILQYNHSEKNTNTINNDISLNNQLSIVADPTLIHNLHNIVYVTFSGIKWKVSSVSVQPPRLVLTFTEPYKEDESDEE